MARRTRDSSTARPHRGARAPRDRHPVPTRWRVLVAALATLATLGGGVLAAHALTGRDEGAGPAAATSVGADELGYYLSISDDPDDTGPTARAAALQAAGRDEALLRLARRYGVTTAASLPALLSAAPSSPTGVTYGVGSYDQRSLHSKTVSDLRSALEKVLSPGPHPVVTVTDSEVVASFHADPARWSSGSRTLTLQRLSVPVAAFPDAGGVTAALRGGAGPLVARTPGAGVTTLRVSDSGAAVGAAPDSPPAVSPATQQQLAGLGVGGHTVPTVVDGRWRVDTLTAVTTDEAAALSRSRAGIRAQLLDAALDRLVAADLAAHPVRLAG